MKRAIAMMTPAVDGAKLSIFEVYFNAAQRIQRWYRFHMRRYKRGRAPATGTEGEERWEERRVSNAVYTSTVRQLYPRSKQFSHGSAPAPN